MNTQNERLYRNEDLENGNQLVYARSLLVVNKIDKNKVKFSLIVTYIKSGYKPTIVPRQVIFNFSNGKNLICNADEYDSPDLDGVVAERCFFRISMADMEEIRSSAIRSFTIVDTRTNQSLRTSPFKSLFQEQVQCLVKRQIEL